MPDRRLSSAAVPRPHHLALCLLATIFALLLAPGSTSAQSAARWFLAEGASNAVLEQEILVGNPSASALTVTVRLLPDPSAIAPAPLTKTFALGASSRLTVILSQQFPNLNGAASAEVSAVIAGSSTPADIVVERSMYFPDGTRAGGHNAAGVTQAAERWILAEGATGVFDTFVLAANPNAAATTIRATYLTSAGLSLQSTLTAPAQGRVTFWPRQEHAQLANAEFSTVVDSLDAGQPIVAERAMYFDPAPTGSRFARSGHDALGVPEASRSWYFAEGFTGGNAQIAFETFLLLANTNATPVTATVTYQLDSGGTVIHDYPLAPNQRFTIWVDQAGRELDMRLRASAFGITVQASQPIVAERAMYWGTPSAADPTTPVFPWLEGHATAGATELAPRWAFAEGRDGQDAAGRLYSSFFLLSNPAAQPVTVRATLVTEDGGGVVSSVTVPARGRANLWPNADDTSRPEFAALRNRRFAAFLESTGNEPFVAERAMYWSGFAGGHNSLGTPWTGAIAVPARGPGDVTVTSITPSRTRLSGGEAITITGTGFSANAEATMDGMPMMVTMASSTSITALTPVRTTATGFGRAGTSTIRLTASGATRQAGTIARALRVLAIGDSFTEGQLVDRNFSVTPPMDTYKAAAPPYPEHLRQLLQADPALAPGVVVRNAGAGGECVSTSGCSSNPSSGQGRLAGLLSEMRWDIVIIMEGFNDLNNGRNAGNVVDALRDMGRRTRASGALPVMAILDGPMTHLEGAIRSMADQEGFARRVFRGIEIGTDGVHPTQRGYDDMARQAYDTLSALIPQ